MTNRLRISLLLLALAATVPSWAPALPPPTDYILCSCRLCADQPDTECQISPSGYSILCADYLRIHNC